MSDLVAHLGAQFKKHFPEKIPDKILIALSGGIDSMALVYAAHSLSKQLNFKLHALTINHNLRGDSTDEAAEINILMQQSQNLIKEMKLMSRKNSYLKNNVMLASFILDKCRKEVPETEEEFEKMFN